MIIIALFRENANYSTIFELFQTKTSKVFLQIFSVKKLLSQSTFYYVAVKSHFFFALKSCLFSFNHQHKKALLFFSRSCSDVCCPHQYILPLPNLLNTTDTSKDDDDDSVENDEDY